MYADQQRVWIKSLQCLGIITERHWVWFQGKRHASYIVELPGREGQAVEDYATNGADLRAADAQCDCCARWLPDSSFNGGWRDEVLYCFLCRHSDSYSYSYYDAPRVRGYIPAERDTAH